MRHIGLMWCNGNSTRRALLAAGVALFATIGAAPAGADPGRSAAAKPSTTAALPADAGAVPDGFRNWAELYALQDKLNAAANRILAAGGTGNASIVAAPRNRELRVYWKGDVPQSMSTVVAGLDVPVKFLPAAYTHDELVAEARRLATDSRIAEVAPKPDGSGLDVTVTSENPSITRVDTLATARVPVSVKTGKRPQSMGHRQADTPPFWGGSVYVGLLECSNGFAIRFPGQPDVYMMTAGHCGNDGTRIHIPARPNNPVGTLGFKPTCRDTALINYRGGVDGEIYIGPWNSTTTARVTGAVADFVGNFVNTGGATSGEHRNIEVQAVDTFSARADIPCTTVGPMTRAGYSNNSCANAPGDSGGPVYSNTPTGVQARGIISAGALGTASCLTAAGLVDGSHTVWYAPLLRPSGGTQAGALQYYGVEVLPG